MSDRMIGCLAMLVIIVVCFALLVASWFFYIYNSNFRRCVALENGLKLGHNAVFDLGRPLFLPIVVPKLPNGRPLADTDFWSVFVSDTTLYGLVVGGPDDTNYAVAWRADTGLVLSSEDRALYDRLEAEAGDVNVGIGPGDYGPGVVMEMLTDELGYSEHRCRTRLVTW